MLGAPDKGSEGAEESTGSLGAAKDILAAVKDSDPGALDAALKLHYEECHGSEEEEDAEGD